MVARPHRRHRLLTGLTATLVGLLPLVMVTSADAAPSPTGVFNYAEALQKAVWFYDAQRLGRLPADNRVSWRGDSFTADGADVGLNLVGGFADAGDTIKASFPLVHSLATLAWGIVEYPQGYSSSGQTPYLLSNLRWGMDYLIRAHPTANQLVTEVGDPNKDHQLWASAEVQTYQRQTYLMNSSCWGADLADSAAAAFAAASMAFRSSDPTYAATLLTHARQLWSTTETLPKAKYDDCTPIVKGFYNSWSGFGDELVWGSLWLYRATGEQSYLDRARAYYPGLPRQGQGDTSPIKYSWTLDWDDKTAASVILLAQLTGDAQAVADARNWADFNAGAGVGGQRVTLSPGGEAFYGTWGSLRYSSGAAFLAFVLADSGRLDATRNQQLHDFAVRQINYILGDNPSRVSYMVGFGTTYIRRPHHRTAHGPWSNHFNEPVENRHILYGALIGGPTAADDNYGPEDRNAFQKSEVSLDYNAAFTSALARMAREYGGTPVSGFPRAETPDTELYVQASLNQANSNFVEIKSLVYNHTAFPARYTPNLSYRYYFTLDPGTSPSQIQLSKAYAQCADPTGPTQFSGSVYYVTISCAGQNLGPIGQSESRRENQFRITFPAPHDHTKDWSFAGVSTNQATPTDATRIVLFDGTRQVWGTLPSATSPSPSISVSPSASVSPSPSQSPSQSPQPGSLRARYKNNDSAPTDGQIKPGLTLVNGGTSAVSLSTVTIRYYFTAEAGPTTYNTHCDYAQVGCANVTTRVVTLGTPVAGADRYLEVGFTSGTLAAGATLGEVQSRFNKSDWSAFSETNDYSYATNTAFADSTRVTVHIGGQVVWGSQP
jgi:endoglucanase